MLFSSSALLTAALPRAAPDFGPSFVPSTKDNMNGEYVFSSTPGGTPGLFPKKYRDYPGGVDTFDVLSPPMTTHYSQVWWSPLAPSPLPAEVVAKYAGKKMAIVGWEIDQVRQTPEGDKSVPISATYNHHYVARMIGGSAAFRKVQLDGPDDPRAAELNYGGHGVAYDQPQYLIDGLTQSNSAQFSSANGGEYRKTYHGFAPGHALVIDSPSAMQITPMQIDTWNRDEMDLDGELPPKFVPGPLPRAALAPTHEPRYSALLECPMTTRISKHIDGAGYVAQTAGACGTPILTFQECFAAASATIGGGVRPFVNASGSDATKPAGCSATVDAAANGTVRVYFNSATTSGVGCAAGAKTVAGEAATLADAAPTPVRVSLALDAASQRANITLSGPADVWFGVGFGAHAMADAPWTLVVLGNGTVGERNLADQKAGTPLPPSVSVVRSSVADGVRTVLLSRPLQGKSASYYSFTPSATDASVPIITALGNGAQFDYHKAKSLAVITLLPVGSATGACVCPQAPKPFGQATGKLVYTPNASQPADVGQGFSGFGAHKCSDFPATTLLNQTNPTCDIRHYRGGQWACHHMWSLLDADQEIPWADRPLVFHHKYRFWVQPYNASYHTPLTLGESVGSALLIGGHWEYDVPKCAHGVPGCSLVDGTWIHTVTGSTTGRHTFVALNFHCHAPTCLSMAVYACAKGTPLAQCNASVGKLICMQRPVYGGSGAAALNGTRFDEPGYIAIPDCFWGDRAYGLEPPQNLSGVPLHMVKTSNATYGHYGEMAGGQPWVY